MKLTKLRRHTFIEWFSYGLELLGLWLLFRGWWIGDATVQLLGLGGLYRAVELDKEAKLEYGSLYRRDQ